MSAVPEDVMRPVIQLREQKRPARERRDPDTWLQKFWHWFALGTLLFCWIAEATMCAERGF